MTTQQSFRLLSGPERAKLRARVERNDVSSAAAAATLAAEEVQRNADAVRRRAAKLAIEKADRKQHRRR